jgi:hypothetical protein
MRFSPLAGALLALLLAVFAVAPLAYPGFFESQSGFQASFRVQQLQAVGVLDPANPVRGEGVLPYYLAWPFFRLSGSGVVAVKWGYGLAFALGALAVYAWARLRLGNEGGVLAAAVYTYLPWHLATVYLRGAYAEAWLWTLWPAALLAWEAPVRRGRWAVRLAGVLLAAAACLAQPGLTFLFLVLMVPYAVAVWRVRWWPARAAAVLAAAGLLLGGARMAAVLGGPRAETRPAEGFLYPYQLLSAAWTQDLSGDALPYQLGAAAVALAIVALGLWAAGRREAGAPRGPGDGQPALPRLAPALWFWLSALLVALLLTLRLSAPLWSALWLGSLVVRPWQLLALVGLPLAFLAGSAVRVDRRLAEWPLWAGLVALVILASYFYLVPRFTQVDPGAAPLAELRVAEAEGPAIHLLAAEVTPAAGITSTIVLTLTWQTLAPLETDYTVFVHLLAGETKVAQADSWPCGGECPTHEWQSGEIVVDVHEITLPARLQAGPYRVALGLYDGVTGERVAVAGREDGTVFVDVR